MLTPNLDSLLKLIDTNPNSYIIVPFISYNREISILNQKHLNVYFESTSNASQYKFKNYHITKINLHCEVFDSKNHNNENINVKCNKCNGENICLEYNEDYHCYYNICPNCYKDIYHDPSQKVHQDNVMLLMPYSSRKYSNKKIFHKIFKKSRVIDDLDEVSYYYKNFTELIEHILEDINFIIIPRMGKKHPNSEELCQYVNKILLRDNDF